MIADITIEGLGPHAHQELSFPKIGTVIVRGPVGVGKSTICDALALLLTGKDSRGKPVQVDSIHQDCAAVACIGTTHGGRVLERRMTKAGRWTRFVTEPSGERSGNLTDEEFRERMKLMGDTDLVLGVLSPFYWEALMDSEKGGVRLRELLDRVLPGERAEELLAKELQPGEPRTRTAAEAARTAANKAQQQAQGAKVALARSLQDARDAVAAIVAPTEDEERAAREAVERYELKRMEPTPDTGEAAHREWKQRKAAHDARAEERRVWQVKHASLRKPDGDAPVEGAIEGARSMIHGTKSALALRVSNREHAERACVPTDLGQLEQESRDAIRRERDIEERLAVLMEREVSPCAGVDASLCCASKNHDAAIKACEAELTVAKRAAVEAQGALDRANQAEEKRLAPLREKLAKAKLEEQQAQAQLTEYETALSNATATLEKWSTYNATVARLGTEPVALPDPGPEPVVGAPVVISKPTEAMDLLQRATVARATIAASQGRIQAAEDALARADADLVKATAAAARAEEVVQLVTSAPGRSLSARLGPFQRDGLTVTVAHDGSALNVRWEGRPWAYGQQSTGERALADAVFRDALRKAARCPWALLVVDGWQDCAGRTLPPMCGPTILLETTAGGTLEVVKVADAVKAA